MFDIDMLIFVLNSMQSAGFQALEIALWVNRTYSDFKDALYHCDTSNMGDVVLVAVHDWLPRL